MQRTILHKNIEDKSNSTRSLNTSIDSYGSEIYKNFKINPEGDETSSFRTSSAFSSASSSKKKDSSLDYVKIAKKYAKQAKQSSILLRRTYKMDRHKSANSNSPDRKIDLSAHMAASNRLTL